MQRRDTNVSLYTDIYDACCLNENIQKKSETTTDTATEEPDASQPPPDKDIRAVPKKVTDADIVSRLDEKQLKTVSLIYDVIL